jgi:RNA recognition motif-containing protein
VSTTVFVGNLPWSATEEELREFFAECGEILGVRIGEPLESLLASVASSAP